MSGKCYGCGTGFSFFKKELGCKNCGFAFCKECLHKKAPVPKLGNEKHKVCNKCFNILTGKTRPSNPAKYSPPEAYKKRMAALTDGKGPRVPQPRSSSAKSHSAQPKYPSNMSKEDISIAERLDKLKSARQPDPATIPSQKEMEQRLNNLKADKPPPPSEDEIAARVARLRGVDPATPAAGSMPKPDRRNEEEKVHDLLDQVMDEVELDTRMDNERVGDVENRLNKLKGNKTGTLEKNLNRENSTPRKDYSKEILSPEEDYKSVSGEDVNWTEMQALINQVASEVEVDAAKALSDLQKDKEIRDRLNEIKAKQKKSSTSNMTDEESSGQGAMASSLNVVPAEESDENEDEDEETEEEAIKRIIKQSLEEAKLEEKDEMQEIGASSSSSGHSDPSASSSGKIDNLMGAGALGAPPVPPSQDEFEEELPWCCICSEDATLRCHGCEDDLYCNRCYREGHDREDYADHQTSPFKQSSSSKASSHKRKR